jgi:hypothetical protein
MKKAPSARQLSRFALGTAVIYDFDDDSDKFCMVVGCWRWKYPDAIGQVPETREKLFNVCPQQVEWAQGYLLMPNDGSGWLYAWFGDVNTGKVKAA